MTVEELKDRISESYPDQEIIVFQDPDYADAFIGVSSDYRAVYDYDKMAECLASEEGMSYEDAVEFIDYNTLRALPYMGENAPIVVFPLED